jgi:hypothetical protein
VQHSIKAWGRLAVESTALTIAAVLGSTACGPGTSFGLRFTGNNITTNPIAAGDPGDPVAAKPEKTGLLMCPASMKGARSPLDVTPPSDAAVVVFLRPSSSQAETEALIVDDDDRIGVIGRFLGQSQATSYFAVTVAPGEHRFMAWAESAGALHATLAPGKKYYVEVVIDDDGTRLVALAPSRKGWNKVPAQLAASAPLIPNEQRGQTCLIQSTRAAGVWTERARTALRRYDPRELAEHTLRSEDGQ